MDSLLEKFSKLGCDNAPGQEGRQKAAVLDLRGEKLEGRLVDFSHGDVDAHPPIPGTLSDFVTGVEKIGGHQAYTEYRGNGGIRGELAQKISAFTGSAIDPDQNIILTPGTQGALFLAVGANMVAGDKVAIVEPDYFANRKLVEFFGGEMVPVQMDYENAQDCAGLDLTQLEKAFQDGAKLFLFSNPNNPTGVVYSAGTLERMADILRAKEKEYGTAIVLISDEPYRELAYDGVEVPYVTGFYDDTVICYSYSKSLSLPGERIGYLVIPDELQDSKEVFNAATIANRVMGCVNAPSLMQRVIKRCIDEQVNLEAYDKNRNLLYNGLKDLGFVCIKPQGAFYLFVKSPEADEKKFCEACKKHNVLVVPGSSFACPGYVRISYCVSYGQIERSLPAFAKIAAEYGL